MADIDYEKLLSGAQSGIVSTVGLDPATIASFSGQAANQQARREAILRALMNKPQAPTMVDIDIGGKQYKVPAQHVGSILNAQSLIKERESLAAARNVQSDIAKAEEERRVKESTRKEKGLIDGYTPDEYYKIQAAKQMNIPTPGSDLAQKKYELDVQKFGSAEADKIRKIQEDQIQKHNIILSGKNLKGNKVDDATRSLLADEINREPIGNTFYFENPNKGLLSDDYLHWTIPQNFKVKNIPITKEVIIDQYNKYGQGMSLYDFINTYVIKAK